MRNSLLTILALACTIAPAFAADAKTSDRIDAAADAVTDLLHAGDRGVPKDLLDRARCVVVIPGLKKAGFILGAKYGRGFAVCRHRGGSGWTAPLGMRIEGGSVGFQIGGSEQDVLLLVMNDGGMTHILSDKFTLGGEATVAAGPVGRDAQAQTDAAMHAEMLAYSRSRGVFAGIALQGATLRPDDDTNKDLYGHKVTNREVLDGSVKTPAVARKLDAVLNADSRRRT
ncbi:MAG: lipid-binding SYLF domain-containing protein [Acidobacteriota bacterium]|nr:lipid-binding SYLF domain-containing protein [Acidobacteriota bacterium]